MEYKECNECPGWCCATYNGIRVRHKEFNRIARYLHMPMLQFKERYIRRDYEDPDAPFYFKFSKPCTFWINDRCSIHPVKPSTCSNFDPRRVPMRTKCEGYPCELIQHYAYERYVAKTVKAATWATYRDDHKK